MARRAEDDHEMPGGDSFLDVIANMVGILIILVMVVGVRAGKASHDNRTNADEPVARESLNELTQQATSLERRLASRNHEVNATVQRALGAWRECKLVDQQRVELEMIRAATEQELEDRRSQLDQGRQREFDVQRQIVEKQIELNELTQEQMQLVSRPLEIEQIESTPTPIARTDSVNEDAIHLRLRHGNVAVVPFYELQQEAVTGHSYDYMRRELGARAKAADVYGPINGFRLRFRVEIYDQRLPGTARFSAAKKQVIRGVYLPETDDIGQPLEQALLPGTHLSQALRNRPSNTTAVVAWVYPDSYDELRTLKRVLWEQGVPLAVWPLSDDRHIEFSSNGVKAAAQ